jgi:hypothetical protein
MLWESEDGMTINQIAEAFGDPNRKSVQKTVKLVYGLYIDRWTVIKKGTYAAVYMCVDVPVDAPHPTERYLPKTQWHKEKRV